MSMADLNVQFQDLLSQVQAYFGQLDQVEQYTWGGVLLGFLMVVAGIVLFFI
jgi:hypothetical protein